MHCTNWPNKLFLNFQIVQEVPRIYFINICQRLCLPIQELNLRISNWFKSNSIFETKINFSKIQKIIMGSFIILLGSSINIFIILWIVKCPKLKIKITFGNYQIAIFKHYEQMLCKTLYFATQIFVELLHVMGRLHEFWQSL